MGYLTREPVRTLGSIGDCSLRTREPIDFIVKDRAFGERIRDFAQQSDIVNQQ
jgi:hypothetical protein